MWVGVFSADPLRESLYPSMTRDRGRAEPSLHVPAPRRAFLTNPSFIVFRMTPSPHVVSRRGRRARLRGACPALPPQECFRLSSGLTRLLNLWLLAALFLTGMPLHAETLLLTQPYTLTGHRIVDNKLGDLVVMGCPPLLSGKRPPWS